MKERPILFSGPMVRAILEGRKTQTRRVIKPQSEGFENLDNLGDGDAIWDGEKAIYCPYGQIEDRLWVRENAYIAPVNFCPRDECNCFDLDGFSRLVGYSASMSGDSVRCAKSYGVKQTPSIHMPRWASRITLEITGIRVERLREMSNEDAQAEGIQVSMDEHSVNLFADLWDSINGKTYPWASNPWVWVIEFKNV